MGKVLSFEPRVGKVKIGLTSSGFTVIIPILIFNVIFFYYYYWFGAADKFSVRRASYCPCCPFSPLYSKLKGMFILRFSLNFQFWICVMGFHLKFDFFFSRFGVWKCGCDFLNLNVGFCWFWISVLESLLGSWIWSFSTKQKCPEWVLTG